MPAKQCSMCRRELKRFALSTEIFGKTLGTCRKCKAALEVEFPEFFKSDPCEAYHIMHMLEVAEVTVFRFTEEVKRAR
jgi:Fe-S oxidoreductase